MKFIYFMILLMLWSRLDYAQPNTSKPMPDGEIETILVGAKRMTVKDILDSVAVHRQPDTNPYMLLSTLSMRLYKDSTTYFYLKKESYLNRLYPEHYSFNIEKGDLFEPEINRLTLEQEGRQKEIVQFHKLDIDRAIWPVRHKEWGAFKVNPETKDLWREAQTYDQYNLLLEETKQNPATQREVKTISYAVFSDSFLVPVSMTHVENFSPVAAAKFFWQTCAQTRKVPHLNLPFPIRASLINRTTQIIM